MSSHQVSPAIDLQLIKKARGGVELLKDSATTELYLRFDGINDGEPIALKRYHDTQVPGPNQIRETPPFTEVYEGKRAIAAGIMWRDDPRRGVEGIGLEFFDEVESQLVTYRISRTLDDGSHEVVDLSVEIISRDEEGLGSLSSGLLDRGSRFFAKREIDFGVDFDGDGLIGDYKLLEESGKVYLLEDPSTEELYWMDDDNFVALTRSHGLGRDEEGNRIQHPFTKVYEGKRAIGADTWRDNTGNILPYFTGNTLAYLDEDTSQIDVFKIDSEGKSLRSYTIDDFASQDFYDLELDYKQDLNGDGYVGISFAEIESEGSIELLVEPVTDNLYMQIGNAEPISIISHAAVVGIEDIPLRRRFGHLIAKAAESITLNGETFIALASSNIRSRDFSFYEVDDVGKAVHKYHLSRDSEDFLEHERAFSHDLDGNGYIGFYDRVEIESDGDFTLQKDAVNRQLYIQRGNKEPIALMTRYSSNGELLPGEELRPFIDTRSGWMALASEAIAINRRGRRQITLPAVAMRHSSQQQVSVHTFLNGKSMRPYQLDFGSDELFEHERKFIHDLDDDGFIGAPRTREFDLDGDGFVDDVTHYRMWRRFGGVDLQSRSGQTFSDDSTRQWDAIKAADLNSAFNILLEGEGRRRSGLFKVIEADNSGVVGKIPRKWMRASEMTKKGYEEIFDYDFNQNGAID